MSLKVVHIAFIAASVVMLLVFGGWSLLVGGSLAYTGMGLLALAAAGGLVVYGIHFVRTMRDVRSW